MTDDLIAFLTARLDEDEALARQAAQVAGPDWTWKTEVPEGYGEPTDYVTTPDGTLLLDTMGGIEGDAPHVARHDPVRVLREVEADRKLIAAYVAAKADVPPVDDWYEVADGIKIGVSDGLESALKIRIARFDDHPGYRPEWKP